MSDRRTPAEERIVLASARSGSAPLPRYDIGLPFVGCKQDAVGECRRLDLAGQTAQVTAQGERHSHGKALLDPVSGRSCELPEPSESVLLDRPRRLELGLDSDWQAAGVVYQYFGTQWGLFEHRVLLGTDILTPLRILPAQDIGPVPH